MVRSLLGLDLALSAGYVFWKEGEPTADPGLLQIDSAGDLGMRLAQYYKWLLRVTREHAVTDIAVEAPVTAAGKEDKIIWLVSAYGVTKMLGAQCRINVVKIRNSDWFPHWCGTNNIVGEQRKIYSVLECQRRGFPKVIKHDTADAIGCLSYRCRELNVKTPWDSLRSPGPLFTGAHLPKGTAITASNQRAAAIITNKALSFDRQKVPDEIK